MKNLLNSIMQDQDLFEDANNDITSALEALEENRRHDAIGRTLDVLSISSDITQRLAAMYLYNLALTEKNEEITEALKIAYDTSDRIEHCKMVSDDSNAALQMAINKLDETIAEFNEKAQEIRDKWCKK